MDRVLIVDGNNVMGSRPDGWWRDRAGAARRLVGTLGAWAAAEGRDVLVVFDGRAPADPPAAARVTVRYAERGGRDAADDVIARLVAEAAGDAEVVTSDAGLAARVRAAGGTVRGAGGFRDALDAA